MHRYVISLILKSEHIGEYQGRTWVIEATSRPEAMRIAREQQARGTLRIMDSTEEEQHGKRDHTG